MTQHGKVALKLLAFFPRQENHFSNYTYFKKRCQLNVFDSQDLTLQAMEVVSDVLSSFKEQRLCIVVLRFW